MRRRAIWRVAAVAFAAPAVGILGAAVAARQAEPRQAEARQAEARQAEPRQAQGRPAAIDVFVYDADGRPVTDLRAAEFAVTIDGAPREVRSARYVYRGPGAETAARSAARSADPAAAPMFEPRRTILVVVDETSFPRGAEKSVAEAADRLLDRFGPGDHVALVTIPLPPDTLALSFSGDRVAIRDTLARIVGRGAAVDLLAEMNQARPDLPVTDLGAATAAAAAAAGTGAEGGGAAKPVEESRQEALPAKGHQAVSGAASDRPLDVAARLLAGLAIAPGPKTVILVTGGPGETDRETAGAIRAELQAAEANAAISRAALYVLAMTGVGRGESWASLEQASLATGGSLVRVGRNADQALDRMGLALSGLYRVELEGAATGPDGKPHQVKVSVTRPSVAVRAARRLAPRDDPPFFEAAPPPSRAIAGGAVSAEPAPSGAREPGAARREERDAEIENVVARAAEYIAGYFSEFKNVVAEEEYVQTIPSMRPAETRRMKSDFLLVTAADGNTWVPFRDVFEVDGRAVRDRDDRLRKLFLESPPGTAFEAMARVQDEGARYNLVTLGKTDINVPTFALTILLERNIRGFSFRRGREETVEGARLLRVDFGETATPTIVRGTDGGDVPSSGSLWIDPLTGRVVKTFLRAARSGGPAALAGLTLESTVTFRRSDALGLWVPAEMREAYRLRGNTVEGTARYSKFRSFQVRTAIKGSERFFSVGFVSMTEL